MTNTLHPPQTPRSTTNGARSGVTPSFSFGLGFLPSFQFSSPMNIINSISPQRFFQVSNDLNKVVGNKIEHEHEIGNEKNHGSEDTQGQDKKNAFNSFTPPPSSNPTSNKFLDTIASQASKKHKQKLEENDSSNDVSIDVSSLNTDNYSSHNVTDSTSLYTNDSSATFVTPNTKFKETNLNETQSKAAPKLVPIKPRTDILSDSLDISTPASRSFSATASATKTRKKRKISHDLTESPSTSIASKIDIIASPARKLSRTDTSSTNSTSAFNEKVWNPEIDEVLLSCYLKFKTFKELQAPASSILKYSSQNKILSRMLLNKTGVLRTPKQIASRLFRLTKLKRPAKYQKEFENSPILNDELDALMNTPLEDLIDSSKIDSIDNDELDQEIGSILSSSPIFTRDNNKNNSMFSETYPSSKKSAYCLNPKEISILFNDKIHKENSHKFTTFCSTSRASLNKFKLRSKLNKNINRELNDSLISNLTSNDTPIWLVHNKLNFNRNKAISPVSDLSPFSSTPSVSASQKMINFENGSFISYMKINVTINRDKIPDMLQWKCMAKVYNGDRLILKKNEIVNGYLHEQENTFELQVPFLKDFWSGYLSFLNDGHDDISELQNLSVMQIIYEDDSEFNEGSSIYGVIVHDFSKELYSEGSSHLTSISISDRATFITDVEEEDDDNATEIADSSPLKNSSPDRKQVSPSVLKINQNLKIDIFKANNSDVSHGPFTAPIYDASAVHKINPNVLKQQEQLKIRIQHHQIQQQLLTKMQSQGQIQMPLQMQPHPQLQVQPQPENQDAMPSNGNIRCVQPALLPSRSTGHIQQTANVSQSKTQFDSPSNNIQAKLQTADTSRFMMQNQNDNESTRSTESFLNTPQLHQQGLVTSIPIKTQQVMNNAVPATQMHASQGQNPIQLQGTQLHGTNFNGNSITHPHMMVNGYSPFNSFQSDAQGQYILQQQYQFQQQQQQQMHMMYHQMQQNSRDNFASNNTIPPYRQTPDHLNKKNKVLNFESNKENSKPKEITFCPILEYDPSKDVNNSQKKSTSKHGIGINKFPVNTPVSMYKPKKK